MCGRYTLHCNHLLIKKQFKISNVNSIQFSYNIAPTEIITVIVEDTDNEQRLCMNMRWGLIPGWQKNINSTPLINARLETVESKPAFRNAFKSRRCLIPADGFFEWKTIDNNKKPYLISYKNELPFAMAGIWEQWTDEKRVIESCCIITTASNDLLGPLHDRSPGIIRHEHYSAWLQSSISDHNTIKELVSVIQAHEINVLPVSPLVNRASYKGEECILSIDKI